jgi:immune inhibitor A
MGPAMPFNPYVRRDRPASVSVKPSRLDAAGPLRRPVLGMKQGLVLLIDFPNLASSHDREAFEALLFQAGGNSLVDYYREVSCGAFTINGSVLGWFRAPEPDSFYVADSFGIYRSYPNNAQRLVEDAVRAADPTVNFADFDENRDGVVENLFIVHAGAGAEEDGSKRRFWSHKWQLSGTNSGCPGAYQTADGVKVDAYSLEPEEFVNGNLISIGVFAHEYGHMLGLPDLYDTDYSSSGLGWFCLMAAGSWARKDSTALPGSSPTHISAWGKYQLGWVNPRALERDSSVTEIETELSAVAGAPVAWRLLENPSGPDWSESGGTGEYFLVENRYRTGFDLGLPGSGLMVTHVDESRTTNSDETHPLVGILQANHNSGLLIPKGSWGGADVLWRDDTTGVRPFTVPSSAFYSGVQSGVLVRDIGRGDSIIRATLEVKPLFLGRVVSYPNPFLRLSLSDHCVIQYAPSNPAKLADKFPPFKVRIFNLAGDLTRVLDQTGSEVNPHERAATWDGNDDKGRFAPAGLYFYLVELENEDFSEQAKGRLTLIR